MNKQEIKQYIENRYPCRSGIIKARIFSELQENLQKFAKINHDIHFMENNMNKRMNPFLIFPETKSIIVVIFPYNSDDTGLKGRKHVLSRSAWGLDYHYVIKSKLESVSDYLKEMYQASSVVLCDNHPLHDRHLAYLAGLGNYGKNTLLMNKEYGSYFFIGLILTSLTFSDYDEPVYEDLCKDCNRCVNACPTKAIDGSGIIHAKRCMSYLSQEKVELDREFLPKFTKFTFGCDFCQEACVYNSNVRTKILPEFAPKGHEVITEQDLAGLSNKTFKEKYGLSSAAWRGKTVLLRNAILVSANSGKTENLSGIKEEAGYLKQACDYAKAKMTQGDK